MSRVAYVNGQYLPIAQACVHVEDRGFQFADGVYEVWAVLDGRLVEWDGHAGRLERSLGELGMGPPMTRGALKVVLRETLRRNRVRDGIVYIQVTRGAFPRDHAYPPAETPQTVVVTAKRLDFGAIEARAAKGVGVVTTPDDLGLVTEGSSTNAWIVDAEGRLRTRDTNCNILRGITRRSLIDVARGDGIDVAEQPFSVDDAKAAREAFITSASAFVMPVVSVDGTRVGDGRPGPVTQRLRSLYLEHARATAV